MKTCYLILLTLAMFGCKPGHPPTTTTLTAVQAGDLAQRLANEQAQALYQCQPFQTDSPAEFVEGRWVWHNLRGHGKGDVEATVEFAADGAKPSVVLMRLDSRAIFYEF